MSQSNRKTQQDRRTRQAHAYKALTNKAELAELRQRKDADLADLIAKQVEPFIATEVARQLSAMKPPPLDIDEIANGNTPITGIVTP